jgi:hypothetical protein
MRITPGSRVARALCSHSSAFRAHLVEGHTVTPHFSEQSMTVFTRLRRVSDSSRFERVRVPPPASPKPSTHPNSFETAPWPLPRLKPGQSASSDHAGRTTRTSADFQGHPTDVPPTTVNGVVLAVLVDPGAEAGGAELESHLNPTKKPRLTTGLS